MPSHYGHKRSLQPQRPGRGPGNHMPMGGNQMPMGGGQMPMGGGGQMGGNIPPKPNSGPFNPRSPMSTRGGWNWVPGGGWQFGGRQQPTGGGSSRGPIDPNRPMGSGGVAGGPGQNRMPTNRWRQQNPNWQPPGGGFGGQQQQSPAFGGMGQQPMGGMGQQGGRTQGPVTSVPGTGNESRQDRNEQEYRFGSEPIPQKPTGRTGGGTITPLQGGGVPTSDRAIQQRRPVGMNSRGELITVPVVNHRGRVVGRGANQQSLRDSQQEWLNRRLEHKGAGNPARHRLPFQGSGTRTFNPPRRGFQQPTLAGPGAQQSSGTGSRYPNAGQGDVGSRANPAPPAPVTANSLSPQLNAAVPQQGFAPQARTQNQILSQVQSRQPQSFTPPPAVRGSQYQGGQVRGTSAGADQAVRPSGLMPQRNPVRSNPNQGVHSPVKSSAQNAQDISYLLSLGLGNQFGGRGGFGGDIQSRDPRLQRRQQSSRVLGTGGAQGGYIPDLAQKAYDDARAANEARYQEGKAGYEELAEQLPRIAGENAQQLQQAYGDLGLGFQQNLANTSGQVLGGMAGERGRVLSDASNRQGALGQDYLSALDRLNALNTVGREPVLGGYEDRTQRNLLQRESDREALEQGYQNRLGRGMEMLRGLGSETRDAIETRYGEATEQSQQAAEQDLINRGLSNTTIRNSALSGIASRFGRDRDLALGQLDASLRDQLFGAYRGLSGDLLGAFERGGDRFSGADERLSGQALQTLERLNAQREALNQGMLQGTLGAMERGNQGLLGSDVGLTGQGLGALQQLGMTGLQGGLNLGMAGVNALERGQGTGLNALQSAGRDLLGFIERRTDQYPDLGQIAALSGQYGAAGGGYGAGMAGVPIMQGGGYQIDPRLYGPGGFGGGGQQQPQQQQMPGWVQALLAALQQRGQQQGGGGQKEGGGKQDSDKDVWEKALESPFEGKVVKGTTDPFAHKPEFLPETYNGIPSRTNNPPTFEPSPFPGVPANGTGMPVNPLDAGNPHANTWAEAELNSPFEGQVSNSLPAAEPKIWTPNSSGGGMEDLLRGTDQSNYEFYLEKKYGRDRRGRPPIREDINGNPVWPQ